MGSFGSATCAVLCFVPFVNAVPYSCPPCLTSLRSQLAFNLLIACSITRAAVDSTHVTLAASMIARCRHSRTPKRSKSQTLSGKCVAERFICFCPSTRAHLNQR